MPPPRHAMNGENDGDNNPRWKSWDFTPPAHPMSATTHPRLEYKAVGELTLAHANLNLDEDRGLRIGSQISLLPSGNTLQVQVHDGLSIRMGSAARYLGADTSANGSVGIGTANPKGRLHVEGAIVTTGKDAGRDPFHGDQDPNNAGAPR